MAGPPVALQALRSGRPVTESRATLAAFFLVIDLAAVLTRGPMALDRSTIVLVAGGLAGYAAGGIASRHVPDQAVRTAVLVLAAAAALDRKSVVSGKSVSGRVDLGGRRILKKKQRERNTAPHKEN